MGVEENPVCISFWNLITQTVIKYILITFDNAISFSHKERRKARDIEILLMQSNQSKEQDIHIYMYKSYLHSIQKYILTTFRCYKGKILKRRVIFTRRASFMASYFRIHIYNRFIKPHHIFQLIGITNSSWIPRTMTATLSGIQLYSNACIRYFYEYEYPHYDKDKRWNELLKFTKYLHFICLLCPWTIRTV